MANCKIHFYMSQSDHNSDYLHALDIPVADISRLSLKPFKRLRYVSIAISGARGDLYTHDTTPEGRAIVDYEATTVDGEDYYFSHNDALHAIDPEGISTASASANASAESRHSFREGLIARDGSQCVISGAPLITVDAAHIIPKSKGNEYIEYVVNQRKHLYEGQETITSINDVQNGILLTATFHRFFGKGWVAFLSTPNFGLRPSDNGRGAVPSSRITMQCIAPVETFLVPYQNRDVEMRGSGQLPPAPILLDFMYGICALREWGTRELKSRLKEHQREYQEILKRRPQPNRDNDDDDKSDSDSEGNDGDDPLNDPDYKPTHKHKGKTQLKDTEFSNDMLEAMDYVKHIGLILRGTTLDAAMDAREKQQEEADMLDREDGAMKVRNWLTTNA